MSAIENLLQVMRDLRHPETGCPWDIRQTSASIAPYTLDETHEVIDAIERDDTENLKEELGDLLFNIVFHARIAEEQGQFDFDDVANGIADKMLRRHPHVFGDERDRPTDEAELSQRWQAFKDAEKEAAGRGDGNTSADPVAEIEGSLNSPLYQAKKLQKDAAREGFDWPDINPVFDKLEEELHELRQAYNDGDKDAITDELGDLLFVCVNVARHAKVNPEIALRRTNRKFARRYAYVQAQMAAAGIAMEQSQLETMEVFWQQAKRAVD